MAHWVVKPGSDNASYKQWTTSTGSVHYSLIDEGIPGKNTSDYIYTASPPDRDQFGGDSFISATENITAIRIYFYINGESITKAPCCTIKIYNGVTQLWTGSYSFDTWGEWLMGYVDATGLSIDPMDWENIQISFSSYEGAIPPSEPEPTYL